MFEVLKMILKSHFYFIIFYEKDRNFYWIFVNACYECISDVYVTTKAFRQTGATINTDFFFSRNIFHKIEVGQNLTMVWNLSVSCHITSH